MGARARRTKRRGCVRGCLMRLGLTTATLLTVLLLLVFLNGGDDEPALDLLSRGREVGEGLLLKAREHLRIPSSDSSIIVITPDSGLQPPLVEPSDDRASRFWDSVQPSLFTVRAAQDEVRDTDDGRYQVGQEIGTGFVVACDRYQVRIATAAHVVRNRIPEVLVAGAAPVPAEILVIDETSDIAILSTSNRALGTLTPLEISGSEPSVGQACWVASVHRRQKEGSILGQPLAVISEMLSAYPEQRLSSSWYAISQETDKGYSGAPVVSATGTVVGVLVGGLEDKNGDRVAIVTSSTELLRVMGRAR